MTEPKPMDPERLASLRRNAEIAEGNAVFGSSFIRDLLADRDYQARRAEETESERDHLCRAAANIGDGVVGMEGEYAAMGTPGTLTRAGASLLVTAVRMSPVKVGIACDIEVGDRRMEIIAQWSDEDARTNYVKMAGELERTRKERDDALAEAKRLRARCSVTDDDVRASDATPDKALRYCLSHGWEPRDADDDEDLARAPDWCLIVLTAPGKPCRGRAVVLFNNTDRDGPHSIAETCNLLADVEDRAPLDVLDEIAAMEVSDG